MKDRGAKIFFHLRGSSKKEYLNLNGATKTRSSTPVLTDSTSSYHWTTPSNAMYQ